MPDRFYIGPYDSNSGLQTNYKPFVIPDDAFSTLNNAYVYRGRVRKRFGSRWLGDELKTRLRVNIGATNAGTGNFAGNIPTGVTPAIGQLFSIGDSVFTVNALGTPANLLRNDGIVGVATFNTTTGAVVINTNGAQLNVDVYFYPALPVMGLLSYEQDAYNDEKIIAFDTAYAYEYVDGWTRLANEVTAGAAIWAGSNSQFFWGTTWSGTNAFDKVFFVTNFNENEANFMRFFSANQWDDFRPQLSATPTYLNSARILVVFKNRLLAFNTWEGAGSPGDNYPNRVRYAQIGNPLAADAWRQDIPGKGSGLDCPTMEAIITVEFIRDRLIVYFERSTWELVYTGNQIYPFAWQQINTELGVESTFSIVPFDKVAIGIGNVGIHACSGTNVERIDEKIPEKVFQIHNVDEGVYRVYGIRDYNVEMIYWTFPDESTSSTFPFPNKVLVYNYNTGSWAFNDDSITCFGYLFQPPIISVTWDSTTVTWDDDVSWDSGQLQAASRLVIAGNQEGYTFIVDPNLTTNCAALQITNIISTPATRITSINHNLRVGDFVYIQNASYSDASNGLNNQIFQVISIVDANDFEIGPVAPFTGNYLGGGIISRVSKIDIYTKQYNFYAKQGRNAFVSKVDFLVDKTNLGQLEVNYFASTSTAPLRFEAAQNGSLLGSGNLDTFSYDLYQYETTASQLWRPVYTMAEGEYVQFQITMSDEQMTSVEETSAGVFDSPAFEDFQLHALVITAQPTSNRLQ